jgi:hypothetical protein
LTEREKMIAGLNYRPGDPELAAARAKAQDLIRRYNATIVGENEIRAPIFSAPAARARRSAHPSMSITASTSSSAATCS